MTEIRIGEKGYIEAGENTGNYIVVQDDRARTGGYLIFLQNHLNSRARFSITGPKTRWFSPRCWPIHK